jgi:hypothetical protein
MFHVFCASFVSYIHLDVGYAGAHGDDDDGNASPQQMVQGKRLIEIVDGDDNQNIQCLEHVRAQLIFPIFRVFVYIVSQHDYLGFYRLFH